MSQYSDKKDAPINTSNVAVNATRIAKTSLKIAKKVGLTALKGLALKTMIVLAIIFGFLLLFSLITASVPSGILLKTSDDVASMESNVGLAVKDAFINTRSNYKEKVIKFLNSNYACKATHLDIVDKADGTYLVSNDNCEIQVTFTPNLNEIIANITAYTTAVNGTIDYLSEKKEMFVPEENMFVFSEDGELSLSDYGWKAYKENSNEFNNSESDDYVSTIKANSNKFFVYEENDERWDLNNFYLGTKTKLEERCYVTYTNPTTKTQSTNSVACSIENKNKYSSLSNYKYESRQEEIKIPAWFGSITIPVYYDLSNYKDEELNESVNYVATNANKSEMEAASFVNSLLNDYYNNYYSLLKNNQSDNRNSYFQKLINDGVIMYVPISGLSSNFIQGEPGYAGEIFVKGMDGTSVQIWNKIGQLRKQGTLSTNAARYNCTEFANYWFYCVYGEGHVLKGDGNAMVTNLLNSSYGQEHFYLGSSPAPGGIYSIGSSYTQKGHVGCVDAVDYENQTITISEGNYGGGANGTINTGIRIRVTMTFDEFYQYVKNTGGSQSSWVMFANPKQ